MEKIGESPWSNLSGIVDTHHIVILDDKIWLFSKNYTVQDDHSFGHYVTYRGGYAVSFDLKLRKWSSASTYSSLCDESDLAEIVFVHNHRIFLLLFTHFGGVSFKHLYYFDDVHCSWHDIKSFQVDADCNEQADAATWKSDLIHIRQDQLTHDPIFMVTNESFVKIIQLSVDSKLTAKLSLVYKQNEKLKLRRPVQAARVENKIYWLEGVHGCGFRILPDTLVMYDIETKVETTLKIDGDCPPFSFSGAKCTAVLSSGEWIHALGDTAVGMSSSKFCGQIWQLTLKSDELKWQKLTEVMLDCDSAKLLAVFVERHRILYVIDPKFGVLKVNV